LKFDYDAYLQFDPCAGEARDLADRTVELRRAKKDRPCYLGELLGGVRHIIRQGEVFRLERAREDGLGDSWGIYAVCLNCIDKHLAAQQNPPKTQVE